MTNDRFILSSGNASNKQEGVGRLRISDGYGLFLVNVDDMKIIKELVYLESYIDSPTFIENQNIVLFIRSDKVFGGTSGRELWAVDADGSNLREIDLGLYQADVTN